VDRDCSRVRGERSQVARITGQNGATGFGNRHHEGIDR
jgi:hypothetical protein